MKSAELETLIRLAKVDRETADRMRAVLELAKQRQIEHERQFHELLNESLRES